MRQCLPRAMLVMVLAVTVLAVLSARAAHAEAPPTREAAIRQTRAALEAQLKDHGGSWEAWGKRLEPFRADVRRLVALENWVKPGADGFLFMNKSVEMLLLDTLEPPAEGPGPAESILATHKQLKARGIDLIVVPIPDKEAVYPDKLSPNAPADREVSVAMRRLMKDLLDQDVEVIDLYTLFRDHRLQTRDGQRLYQKWDTHWHNVATALAGQAIAQRLERYDFVDAALKTDNPFKTQTGSRPGKCDLAGKDGKDKVQADKDLWDPYTAILFKDGRKYEDPVDAPVLLTSDSFGFLTIHVGAHLPAQVAYRIHMPVAHIYAEGLGPRVPLELTRLKDKFATKRVVIWTAVGRSFNKSKWLVLDLPR